MHEGLRAARASEGLLDDGMFRRLSGTRVHRKCTCMVRPLLPDGNAVHRKCTQMVRHLADRVGRAYIASAPAWYVTFSPVGTPYIASAPKWYAISADRVGRAYIASAPAWYVTFSPVGTPYIASAPKWYAARAHCAHATHCRAASYSASSSRIGVPRKGLIFMCRYPKKNRTSGTDHSRTRRYDEREDEATGGHDSS